MRPLWILLLAAVASGQTQPFDWTERTQALRLGPVAAPGSAFAVADIDKDGDFDLILSDSDPARPAAVLLLNGGPDGFSEQPLDLPSAPATAVCAGPVEPFGPPRVFAVGPNGLHSEAGATPGAFRQCLLLSGPPDSPPLLLFTSLDGLTTVSADTLEPAGERRLNSCEVRDIHWTPSGLLTACGAGADRHFVDGDDRGALLGSAYDALGGRQRTVFLTSGDVDGDGRIDLLKLVQEELPLLYRQAEDGFFDAEPAALALGGHRALLADLDLDGDLDLALAQARRIALFRNADGRGRFVEAGAIDGVALAELAYVDLDGDRLAELAVRSPDGAVRVFGFPAPAGFLTVRLEAAGASALGAQVSAQAGGKTQLRVVDGPAEVYFGLGGAESVSRLRIVWPSGRGQLALGLRAGRAYLLREGAPPEGL